MRDGGDDEEATTEQLRPSCSAFVLFVLSVAGTLFDLICCPCRFCAFIRRTADRALVVDEVVEECFGRRWRLVGG